MSVLCLCRLAVDKDYHDETSQLNESMQFFPLAGYTDVNSFQAAQYADSLSMAGFEKFGQMQYYAYNPVQNFYPINCRKDQGDPTGDSQDRTIIAYTSDNDITLSIIQELKALNYQQKKRVEQIQASDPNNTIDESNYYLPFTYKKFDNQDDLRSYIKGKQYMRDSNNPGICFGFEITENGPADYSVKLNFDDRAVNYNTEGIPSQLNPPYTPYTSSQNYGAYSLYVLRGYSYMQNWIANEVLKKATGNPLSKIAMQVFPMKAAAYIDDDFSNVLNILLPFFMLLIYILPIYRMISRIVSEKETKARDSMKIMGLTEFSYWMSWFTYYLILVTIISACILGIISINVIKHSNKFLIFVYFWVYGMSLFGLIMFFQAIFNKAVIAAIAGSLIYFGLAFVDFTIQNVSISARVKYALSIFPPIAVSRCANNISSFEASGIGVNSDNFTDSYQNYKLSIGILMMFISMIAFTLLGLYLDHVLPGVNGFSKPFYFFLQPSYWCGVKKKVREVSPARYRESDEDQETFIFETKYIQRDYYEPVNYDLKKQETDNKILKIQELKKIYPNGYKAVSGLNVKMYNGQIFALLGHNGAGKTTTISMLTGLIQSSAGIAEVFGYDLFNDMSNVRQFLGVCPQHDILFDLLTPEEHLAVFCDFKGVDLKHQKAEIDKMLKDVDLLQHRHTMAKNLSGGNRRKLSVGIALIGGSKFVLLDEPTAGMDLSARRKLWNMLKNYKHNRIIILTTHYMDEADILGDRIGIMSGGQLICLGSSLFLKNRFGVGYNVTMVKKNKEPNNKVGQYFEQHLGPVKKLHEVSSEITYQIPTSLSYKFKDFFENFDRSLDMLDLRSYGISVTTLEEVFLRVGHLGSDIGEAPVPPIKTMEIEMQNLEDIDRSENLPDGISQSPIEPDLDDFCIADESVSNQKGMFFIHLMAVFRKRYYNYRRNFRSLLIEILIPVLLVLLGFVFSKITFFFDSPQKPLSTALYPLKQRILVNSDLVATSSDDITPYELIQNLPNFTQAFDVTYKDYSYVNTSTPSNQSALLEAFDEDVYQQRNEGDTSPYRYGSYYIYEANNLTKQFKVATFLNVTSQDVTAFYPQFMYEAILKSATGNPNFKFNVINAPFPVTQNLRDHGSTINGIFIVFILSIGFALIPASIISFILNEREKNLKHMQLISGMDLSAYWISNYIFDLVKALIPVGLVIALIYAFSLHYDYVWIVLLVYPAGIIPFTYATSFLFTNESIAQTFTIFLHFCFSGIGAIIVYVLRNLASTSVIGDKLMWILKIIPSFCLANSVMFVSGKATYKSQRPDLNLDNFYLQNMGGDLLILAIHFAVWTSFLILMELGSISWLWHALPCNRGTINPRENIDLDEDVIEEENRVAESTPDTMKVRVNRFRKVYKTAFRKPLVAVERTSFGLDYGECFALLGVNGAGKSTTFKSLTNDINATSGQITIGGMDVRRDFSKVRKQIGYCPQHDAIFDLMTVEEHLDYYASIKGITGIKKHQIVEKQIKDMDLEIHRKKPAGTLSGGNKRKLSVAMAVLGNPPIILLDEPSAGMDPEARRFMWDVVAKISQQRKQSAVILTTHSMEEAEALSTKMGIMVRGGIFRCFGSSQHIKNKYGTGYEIEVKVRKLKSHEIESQASHYQILPGTDQITFTQCIELMRRHNIDEFLIGELREDGLGADIYSEQKDSNGMVTVKNFIIWLNVELFGQIIIKSLVEDFYQVEMLEHYNDYYKLRVPRQDKSIGYIFGMIETQREVYGISEYSVSQTTLEQIFQTFALLEFDATKGIVFEKQPNGQVGRRATIPRSIAMGTPARSSSAIDLSSSISKTKSPKRDQ